MRGLITDRTLSDVTRRSTLSTKGWSNMTEVERVEWLGDPLPVSGVNLFPCGPYYSDAVSLKYTNTSVIATALSEGIYLFAPSIVGDAKNYENKIFTLSIDKVEAPNGGIPAISVYWHDETGFDSVEATLFGAGSITVDTVSHPNTNNRKYLALYVYVTQEESVAVGTQVTFTHVMFENGRNRHAYVPYTEILATSATKGAYNYSDLNRVERAVMEISDLAGLNLVTRTDWTMWDIPTASEMERYLTNVQTIRTYCGSEIELPSSMDNLTYRDANNIEKILLAAYSVASAGAGGTT